ncbi:phosphoglycerate dehydrogenase [Magnetococcales bacterium HHB-1]
MAKVLISDKMSPKAEALFRERGIDVDYKPGMSPEELKAVIKDYDGLAIRSATKVTAEILEAATNLKVVGRAGIGVDNVDIPAASQKGVIVMNTPFGNTVTTAEHAIALMLGAARHLGTATPSTKAGKWEKSRFMGKELFNKNVGVLGTGNIGALVVERLQGLKMNVLAYDPFISKERAASMGITLVDNLDNFWPQLDFLTIHTPLTPKTRHIVNQDAFSKMKDGVIVVNAARGGVIDEEALYDALKSGKVFSAAVDVYEQEPARENKLFELDNIVCTPHLGASTTEAQENVAVDVASQISNYLLKGSVQNALNIPSVSEADMPKLRPYLNLADKMGSTLGQLTEAGVRAVRITYEGQVADLNCTPITTTILQAILTPLLDDSVVNLVNAPLIAKERGIEVSEGTKSTAGTLTSKIRIVIETDLRERCITGALFKNEEPRLVTINDIPVEVRPKGNLLFITNQDTPGLIGRVGTLLGDADINIADFHLGRKEKRGTALAVVRVDQDVSDALVEDILKIPNVIEAKRIQF